MNIAKWVKGEKEMKKIMIDNRNAKIIAFALVAVLLLIGSVGMASAAAIGITKGGGLIAYYPFNGDAKDKSGNGNDGTVYGATWVDNGGCVKALSFDGVDDYVDVADDESLHFTDAITVEAWIKTSDSGNQEIVTKALDVAPSTGFCLRYWDGVNFRVYNQDGDTGHARVAFNLADGKWHHLVGTYDGTNVKIFVDGSLGDTKALTGNIGNDEALRIGYDTYEWIGDYFDGTIDEVRIYNYARTQSQIQEDMRKCTPSTPTATAGPTPTTPTTPPANCIYFNTGAWTNLSSVFTNGTEIYGGTNNKYNGTAYMYLWLSFDSASPNISLRPCPDDIDPQTGEPNWGDRAGLAIEEISSTELRSRLTADFVPYELRAELKGPYIYRTVVTAPDHGYHSSYIFSFDTSPNYAIGWGNVDAYDWLARVRVCNLG